MVASFPWVLDPETAIRIQMNLRPHLVLSWDGRSIATIAGVDTISINDQINAAITVFEYPDLTQLEIATAQVSITFPYIPGLLAFRLGPAILSAWKKLSLKPNLLLIHGHGIAHPRGFGLASHLGLWLNTPTIGVAKTLLYGLQSEIGPASGEWREVRDEKHPAQIIGAVLRTCDNVKPIYVSPGHLIDLAHSLEFTRSTCRGYRTPEPLRIAHQVLGRSDPLDLKI